MILHHLSRNKTLLCSGTVWPCCVWGGQVQPHVTTDFGGLTEISDPKYHPFPSFPLSLGMPLPLWWNLPIISLTTNALGKWPHLVVVAERSHIKTWSQIRCSSGVIPTSLCWLEFRRFLWSWATLSLEGDISSELSPSVFQKKIPTLKVKLLNSFCVRDQEMLHLFFFFSCSP